VSADTEDRGAEPDGRKSYGTRSQRRDDRFAADACGELAPAFAD